jgi:hypothetical protein
MRPCIWPVGVCTEMEVFPSFSQERRKTVALRCNRITQGVLR